MSSTDEPYVPLSEITSIPVIPHHEHEWVLARYVKEYNAKIDRDFHFSVWVCECGAKKAHEYNEEES